MQGTEQPKKQDPGRCRAPIDGVQTPSRDVEDSFALTLAETPPAYLAAYWRKTTESTTSGCPTMLRRALLGLFRVLIQRRRQRAAPLQGLAEFAKRAPSRLSILCFACDRSARRFETSTRSDVTEWDSRRGRLFLKFLCRLLSSKEQDDDEFFLFSWKRTRASVVQCNMIPHTSTGTHRRPLAEPASRESLTESACEAGRRRRRPHARRQPSR